MQRRAVVDSDGDRHTSQSALAARLEACAQPSSTASMLVKALDMIVQLPELDCVLCAGMCRMCNVVQRCPAECSAVPLVCDPREQVLSELTVTEQCRVCRLSCALEQRQQGLHSMHCMQVRDYALLWHYM